MTPTEINEAIKALGDAIQSNFWGKVPLTDNSVDVARKLNEKILELIKQY